MLNLHLDLIDDKYKQIDDISAELFGLSAFHSKRFLYHLSTEKRDSLFLTTDYEPRNWSPDTDNPEHQKHICFSRTITGCVRGIWHRLRGYYEQLHYVYVLDITTLGRTPDEIKKNIHIPSGHTDFDKPMDGPPEARLTHEVWVLKSCTVKRVATIRIIDKKRTLHVDVTPIRNGERSTRTSWQDLGDYKWRIEEYTPNATSIFGAPAIDTLKNLLGKIF